MPYKKKAPARKKKFIGGAMSAIKRAKKKGGLGNLISPAARKKSAVRAAARKATQAKNMAGLSADQRNLLGQAQSHAYKQGKGTKAINDYTKKYGVTKSATATGKKVAAKRTAARKAAMAKRLISGQANPLAGKKATGRIFSTMTGSRKAKELARKRGTGGTAISRAAREALKKKQMAAMRGRSGTRIKPRTGGVLSRAKRVIAGRSGTAAQRRARALAARKRALAARRPSRMAAARKRAAASKRRRSPMSRAISSTRRRVATRSRRPSGRGTATRRRSGLLNRIRRVTRRR